jgi:hypothetical protein
MLVPPPMVLLPPALVQVLLTLLTALSSAAI